MKSLGRARNAPALSLPGIGLPPIAIRPLAGFVAARRGRAAQAFIGMVENLLPAALGYLEAIERWPGSIISGHGFGGNRQKERGINGYEAKKPEQHNALKAGLGFVVLAQFSSSKGCWRAPPKLSL